jgi:hypothetical protein
LISVIAPLMCMLALAYPSISQAQETTITTGGPVAGESQGHFGDPGTATYGEVITAPASDPLLDSFTFYLNVSTLLGFHAYLYAWNGEEASGSPLYASGTLHTTVEGAFEPITVNTGGVTVVPGQKYVIFFSIAADSAEDAGTGLGGEWATRPGETYPEGLGTWLENEYSVEAFTTTTWKTTSLGAFAFEARFSAGRPSVSAVSPKSVEEGETVTIEGSNFGGVAEVLFGSTPASGFTYENEEEVIATVPGGVAGKVDVHVVTGAGESPSVPADQVTIAGTVTTTTTTAPTTTTTTSKSTTTTTTTPSKTTTTTTPTTTTTTAPTTTTTTAPTTTTTTTTTPTTTTTTSKSTTTTTTTTTSKSKSTTTTTTTTAKANTPTTTTTSTTTTTTTTSPAIDGSVFAGGKTTSIAPDCVVPELHGLTLLAARHAIAAAHCKVGTVHHAYSRHKKDRVYEQSLRIHTVWPNGHRVSVWDSLGAGPLS